MQIYSPVLLHSIMLKHRDDFHFTYIDKWQISSCFSAEQRHTDAADIPEADRPSWERSSSIGTGRSAEGVQWSQTCLLCIAAWSHGFAQEPQLQSCSRAPSLHTRHHSHEHCQEQPLPGSIQVQVSSQRYPHL